MVFQPSPASNCVGNNNFFTEQGLLVINPTGISACLSDRLKKMEDNGTCKATHYMGDKDKIVNQR